MAFVFAQGTLLQVGDKGTPEMFFTIPQIASMTIPGAENDLLDVTNHDSVNAFRQFINGLRDGGEITFTMFYDPNLLAHNDRAGTPGTSSDGFLKQYKSRATYNYQVVFPTTPSKQWSFAGIARRAELDASFDAVLALDCGVKVSGDMTYPTT